MRFATNFSETAVMKLLQLFAVTVRCGKNPLVPTVWGHAGHSSSHLLQIWSICWCKLHHARESAHGALLPHFVSGGKGMATCRALMFQTFFVPFLFICF